MPIQTHILLSVELRIRRCAIENMMIAESERRAALRVSAQDTSASARESG
jgi:hypothetical protein